MIENISYDGVCFWCGDTILCRANTDSPIPKQREQVLEDIMRCSL